MLYHGKSLSFNPFTETPTLQGNFLWPQVGDGGDAKKKKNYQHRITTDSESLMCLEFLLGGGGRSLVDCDYRPRPCGPHPCPIISCIADSVPPR